MSRVLVIGGSGFIGSHLVARLDAAGHAVTVPTRRRERARHLILLPQVDVVEADVHHDPTLGALIARHPVVVNLVGILHGRAGRLAGPGPHRAPDVGPDFERAHVRLVERIVAHLQVARGAGAAAGPHRPRLIHVSALGAGADPAALPSRYLRSKAVAEAIVRESGLAWTMLRPSVVFGAGDSFLTLFARLQRWLPVLLLPGCEARMQPVHVGDVVQAMLRCLEPAREGATVGRAFDLAGPDVLTLRELVALAGRFAGVERPIVALPEGAGRLQARLMELMPGPTLMSRDNLDSLKHDSTMAGPVDPVLDLHPASIDAIGPSFLGPTASAFNAERRRAGR